jgi:hypothetical protein
MVSWFAEWMTPTNSGSVSTSFDCSTECSKAQHFAEPYLRESMTTAKLREAIISKS